MEQLGEELGGTPEVQTGQMQHTRLAVTVIDLINCHARALQVQP
jgi:hypothetical protein